MRIDPLTAPRPHCGARDRVSGSGFMSFAMLLLTLVAGCEQAGPGAADNQRPPPVHTAPDAPVARTAVEADGDASRAAVAPPAAGNEGARPTPIPIPIPTIGASSAQATSTASEPPILRAVRTGTHPGLDRLVFEFDGAGLPAWHVEYVDRPVRDCGSGESVPVAGDAWLQVRFSGAHAHTQQGASTSGPRRRGVGMSVLRELVRTCDFEAEVIWVAGLARPNPYTARVLAAPSRLVIDIAH